MVMDVLDEIIEEFAEDGYEIYRKLFNAIKEEDNKCSHSNYSHMSHRDISSLAVSLTPIVMKRYYSEERTDF